MTARTRLRCACCALLWLSSLTVLPAAPGIPADEIVPKPQVLTRLGGAVCYAPARTSIRFSLPDTASVMPAVDEIRGTSAALFGASPAIGQPARFIVWVGVPGIDPAFDRACTAGGVEPPRDPGGEGYALRIDRRTVLIAARSAAGAFYGLQTFHQILRGAWGRQGMLPRVRIVDWPAMRVRAVMDDISRGPVPNPAFLREQIRRCAELKVNALTYYTEHVVATRSHPEFAPREGSISVGEWQELASFARRYHIDLIGNFQSFGHFEKILAVPAYAGLGEGKSLLSPAYEESYRLLGDIYREMVPAFTAPWFNVNCDETFDLGRGASRALVDSLGKGRVYLAHLLRLREMLRSLGVRMMVWGDVLLQNPDVIDLLPRDVVIATWTYDSLADFHRFVAPFQTRGFDVLVAPGVLNSASVMPDFRQSLPNIRRFLAEGIREHALGAMTTVWDDGGTAQFMRDWYGVAFAADRMWSCDTADRSFPRRFDVALYGDHRHTLSRAIDTLLRLADLPPTDGMSDRNLWLPAIPPAGASFPLNLEGWARVLVVSASADSLLRQGNAPVWPDDLDAMRFVPELYAATARFYLGVMNAARSYGRAIRLEATDRPQARKCLLSALDTVSSLRAGYARLRARASSLWLRESRLYGLDSVQRPFDTRLRDLGDVAGRLRQALAALEQGRSLPAAGEVRLDLTESSAIFFRDWLVTGPVEGAMLDENYLAAMGGERSPAPPAVAQEFVWGGKTVRWSRLSEQSMAAVTFPASSPPLERSCLYASALIESPAAGTVRALLGSGGKAKVFLNGSPVFEMRQERPFRLDGDTLALPLLKGRNNLLVKLLRPAEGEWTFSFRLPDLDVRNRKNRYRIEERP